VNTRWFFRLSPSTTKNHTKAGHVKEPVPGYYNWVASFDLNSLYPHLIMQYNISPETLLEPEKYEDSHRNITFFVALMLIGFLANLSLQMGWLAAP
jgi:DNA polymerase elongation subunit (family B)